MGFAMARPEAGHIGELGKANFFEQKMGYKKQTQDIIFNMEYKMVALACSNRTFRLLETAAKNDVVNCGSGNIFTR